MPKDRNPFTIDADVAEKARRLLDEARVQEDEAVRSDDPSGTSGSVPDDNRRKEGSEDIDIDITRRSD